MAKIAFILLCHKDPDAVIDQARRLTAAGDVMAIHFDASASKRAWAQIVEELGSDPNIVLTKKRVRCGWGEWSLVQATLNAMHSAIDAFPRATHFYLVSGDCMAIKTAEYVHARLDAEDADFIESFDFFESDWIKTGLKEERLIYRHYVNERSRKKIFYKSLEWQKRLGLSRAIPKDIQMMIGSQWWCLRRQTVERVLEFTRHRRDVMRFFRTTWIPDEIFFQTIVRHVVPEEEIKNRTLTFLMFSDYGMPVTFYNDHYDLLLSQDYLFARKISPRAIQLKERLGDLYAAKGVHFTISNEGQSLFKFLSGRGRVGRRFQVRFWEVEGTLGRERTLLIVACKKWHIGKRIAERIRQVTNLPAVDYLFNEDATAMPDLGGIQNSLEKRTRHRRALMRMLFEHFEADQMLICLDPGDFDLIQDFYNDRSETRLLEVECEFTDEYLVGHAKRVGLAGDMTPRETIERLLPTIRNDVVFESNRLRDAELPGFFKVRERVSPAENARAMAAFLDLTTERAQEITGTEHLFAD